MRTYTPNSTAAHTKGLQDIHQRTADQIEQEDGMSILSEVGYQILRAAVNTARQFQCQNVQALKNRLLPLFPDHMAEIDEAIEYWAANVRKRHPHGVPAN